MKSNHHDHETGHDRKHAGFDHHSEHVFGADPLGAQMTVGFRVRTLTGPRMHMTA